MKVKWLKFRFPKSFEKCGNELLQCNYSGAKGKGFSINYFSKDKLDGMYIERELKKEISLDPFGHSEESIITTYYVVKFSFIKDSGLVRVDSPPRSLKKFSRALHETLGIGSSITDIRIDPLSWFNLVQVKHPTLVISHLAMSELALSKKSLASAIISSSGDAREELDKLADGRPFKVASIRIRDSQQSTPSWVEYSKMGSVKIHGALAPDIERCSEQALEKLVNATN